MSKETLAITALKAKATAQKARGFKQVQLMLKCGKRPAGFPRGEFVAEFDDGNAYAFDCDKLIAWCDKAFETEAGK